MQDEASLKVAQVRKLLKDPDMERRKKELLASLHDNVSKGVRMSFNLCGNYCGPGYCNRGMMDEKKCPISANPDGNPHYYYTEPSCSDTCCMKHDLCCGHKDRHACNKVLEACLTKCGGFGELGFDCVHYGDDGIPDMVYDALEVSMGMSLPTILGECCGGGCEQGPPCDCQNPPCNTLRDAPCPTSPPGPPPPPTPMPPPPAPLPNPPLPAFDEGITAIQWYTGGDCWSVKCNDGDMACLLTNLQRLECQLQIFDREMALLISNPSTWDFLGLIGAGSHGHADDEWDTFKDKRGISLSKEEECSYYSHKTSLWFNSSIWTDISDSSEALSGCVAHDPPMPYIVRQFERQVGLANGTIVTVVVASFPSDRAKDFDNMTTLKALHPLHLPAKLSERIGKL